MRLRNDLKKAKDTHLAVLVGGVCISMLVITVIASLLASQISTYRTKARLSEALIKFPVLKEKIMTEYVFLGHWPKPQILEKVNGSWSGHINNISFDGHGAIHVEFSDTYPEMAHKILSFVATKSSEGYTDKIIWICGYGTPLQGYELLGNNRTSIERKYLPTVCKNLLLNQSNQLFVGSK